MTKQTFGLVSAYVRELSLIRNRYFAENHVDTGDKTNVFGEDKANVFGEDKASIFGEAPVDVFPDCLADPSGSKDAVEAISHPMVVEAKSQPNGHSHDPTMVKKLKSAGEMVPRKMHNDTIVPKSKLPSKSVPLAIESLLRKYVIPMSINPSLNITP